MGLASLCGDDLSPQAQEILEKLADVVRDHVDMDRVLSIADDLPALPEEPDFWDEAAWAGEGAVASSGEGQPVVCSEAPAPAAGAGTSPRADAPRIGYVRDRALWFYYEENLEALRRAGAELVRLSLLDDAAWPELDGLYLGGGFPEDWARELSASPHLARLGTLAARGLPIYAECGGFMVLASALERDGQRWPMSGIFPVETRFCPKPQGLGYVRADVVLPNPYFPQGSVLRGHEFHYSLCHEPAAVSGRLDHALRLRKGTRKSGLKVATVAPFTSNGSRKMNAQVLHAAPGSEPGVLDAIAAGAAYADLAQALSDGIVLVGERAAQTPGLLSAVVALAERTGARLAWVPRRAGDRAAVEAGLLPGLLPFGRGIDEAGAQSLGWGELPARGLDAEQMIEAASSGELAALVVGGVDVRAGGDERVVGGGVLGKVNVDGGGLALGRRRVDGDRDGDGRLLLLGRIGAGVGAGGRGRAAAGGDGDGEHERRRAGNEPREQVLLGTSCVLGLGHGASLSPPWGRREGKAGPTTRAVAFLDTAVC